MESMRIQELKDHRGKAILSPELEEQIWALAAEGFLT
jgi:hypothetical protein